MTEPADRAAAFMQLQKGKLPDLLGLAFDHIAQGEVRAAFEAGERHMAPNGYLHAASVVALADTACGYGCVASLPDGASGFTTIELKSNHLGTAKPGETVTCRAWLAHGGRTTQVWDAEVVNAASGRTMALFRCTQMILYPR